MSIKFNKSALVIFLTLAAYVIIHSFGIRANFFPMDDWEELDYIRRMPSAAGLFGVDVFSLFRPVKNLIFALFLQFEENGWGALPCRLIALAIGVAAYFPVLAFCRRVFQSEKPALAAAAIWLLAPTAVSTTAWLSCVNIQLMTAAAALALTLHDRARGFSFGAVLAFAFALCAYENAIALPAVIFLFDALLRSERLRSRRTWCAYGIYAIVTLVYLALRFALASSTRLGGNFTDDTSRWDLIAAAGLFFVQHLHSWLFPFGRAVLLGFHDPQLWSPLTLALCWLAPLSVSAIALLSRRSAPLLAFGLAAFIVAYLPMSNLLGFGNGPYGDYYLAFSGIGLAIAFVEILRRLWRIGGDASAGILRLFAVAVAIFMAALRVLTIPEAADWARAWTDPAALYRNGCEIFRGATNNLTLYAQALAQTGDLSFVPSMFPEMEIATRRYKVNRAIVMRLGALYAGGTAGNFAQAMDLLEEYRKVLLSDTGAGWYYYYRGCLLEDLQGDLNAAKAEYLQALVAEKPAHYMSEYYDRAARACALTGELERAAELWRNALRLDPHNASAATNLQTALAEIDQKQKGL